MQRHDRTVHSDHRISRPGLFPEHLQGHQDVGIIAVLLRAVGSHRSNEVRVVEPERRLQVEERRLLERGISPGRLHRQGSDRARVFKFENEPHRA